MFTLPELDYSYDALEPHIDAKTMEIHHSKHHQAYVDNLNTALAGKDDLLAMSIEDLCQNLDKVPEDVRTAVRNNGGGHYNHSQYWKYMIKDGKALANEELQKDLEATFGSMDGFKEAFAKAGMGRFGSGWVWLIQDGAKLTIVSTPNQDNPLMDTEADLANRNILLGCDVWEHAYYLKHQNKRADYLATWWNVVNWETVAQNYKK